MKKSIISIFFIWIGISSAKFAFAESYLFPTDILPTGRFDAFVGFQKNTASREVKGDGFGVPLHWKQEFDVVTEVVSARYGLSPDWHVGVEASYRSKDEVDYKTKPDSAIFASPDAQKYDGANNLYLFARHRINIETQPKLSLVVNAGLSVNTAANNYTALNLGVTGGWALNDDLKIYAGYSVFLSDQDRLSDSQSLFFGAHQKISPLVTIIPQYGFTHYDQAHIGSFTTASSRDGQSLGVAAHIEVLPSTYLIPYIGFNRAGNFDDDVGFKYVNNRDNRTYSFSIYHLF